MGQKLGIAASIVIIGAIAVLSLPSAAQSMRLLESQARQITGTFEFTLDNLDSCTKALAGQTISTEFRVGPFQKGARWNDWTVAEVSAESNRKQQNAERGAINITMTLRPVYQIFSTTGRQSVSKTIQVKTDPNHHTIIACLP